MLTRYIASAGSGKTHQLTLEYLILLLSGNDVFPHILAVTFTNKATEEMKSRIVEALHQLKNNPSDSKFSQDIAIALHLNEKEISQKAELLLAQILHNFSDFNISTIDRFFQQVTRAFTREIGLQGGYNLEIDNDSVLSQSIDIMLSGLNRSENSDLLHWLIRLAQEKIENGGTWNIRDDINRLAEQLSKESYKTSHEEILSLAKDKKFLSDYLKELQIIISTFENDLQDIARQGCQLLESYRLTPTDFKGKARSPFTWFPKWANTGSTKEPNKTFLGLANEPEAWYTPPKKEDAVVERIKEIYNNGLNDIVIEITDHFDRFFKNYKTAIVSKKNIYLLGVLRDIDSAIQSFQKDHNLLLLSDTSSLLNEMIDGSDTPFIYEKIGTYIDHFMIDEFQDTSGMQWKNFFPLFKESNDSGNKCLVVGDVKQSIYRWRNSDWKLLSHEIPLVFPGRTDRTLNINRRSCPNIVHFNNSFFSRSADILQKQFNLKFSEEFSNRDEENPYASQISDAYKDIVQTIAPEKKENKTGHIKIQFLEPSKKQDIWKTDALNSLPDTLIELQDRGYKLNDITFLVRKKQEGSQIADFLLKYKASHPDSNYRFDVISDEALYLHNSATIRLIINILKYLQDPGIEINRLMAAYEYEMSVRSLPEKAISEYFSKQGDARQNIFPESISEILKQSKELPLFELCESIIKGIRQKDQKDGIFIQAFQDMVLDYTSSHPADIASFLRWWDETGSRLTISTPQSQEAMRIMTIHKSKGLESKVIIMPFCDWELTNITGDKAPITWSKPTKEPFNKLPLLPITISTDLINTIYAKEYYDEILQQYIDALNLCYVAFTRAKEELILLTPYKEKNSGIDSIATLLTYCLQQTENPESDNLINFSPHYNEELRIFELGNISILPTTAPEGREKTHLPIYESVNPGNRLKYKLHGESFFEDRDIRKYGNLMHDILSRIVSSEDIPKAVSECIAKGELSNSEGIEIEKKLKSWTTLPDTHSWFSKNGVVLNEIDIIQSKGGILRPDRIIQTDGKWTVIDYKFGLTEHPGHVKQVRSYMDEIRKMGHTQVEGYIWYIELEKIIKIEI